MTIWTLWHGTYLLEGVIKAVTAIASVVNAMALTRLPPQALALSSPAQVRGGNDELERGITSRGVAERGPVGAQEQLEQTVRQRTDELARGNDELKAEMERRHRMAIELAHAGRVTTTGKLAASIAHQVSQPLAAVVANAHACLRWPANDPPNLKEARDSVARILRDGGGAGEIAQRIGALLEKTPPKPTEQDVNELLRDALALVNDAQAMQRIDARAELGDVQLVLADRVQLQQVILNLVMNGVDAVNERGDGPRSFVVSTATLTIGKVTMTVRDSGTGVDPAVFDRLFDPFFTTKPEGMSMGLSVSRTPVESHGGRLWASTDDGPRATLHVSLPVRS